MERQREHRRHERLPAADFDLPQRKRQGGDRLFDLPLRHGDAVWSGAVQAVGACSEADAAVLAGIGGAVVAARCDDEIDGVFTGKVGRQGGALQRVPEGGLRRGARQTGEAAGAETGRFSRVFHAQVQRAGVVSI